MKRLPIIAALFVIILLQLIMCHYYHILPIQYQSTLDYHGYQSTLDYHGVEKQKNINQLGNYGENFLESKVFFYELGIGHVRHTTDIPNNIFKPLNNSFCQLVQLNLFCKQTEGTLRILTDKMFNYACNTIPNEVSIFYPYDKNGNRERYVNYKLNDIWMRITFHMNHDNINYDCDIYNTTLLELYKCTVNNTKQSIRMI